MEESVKVRKHILADKVPLIIAIVMMLAASMLPPIIFADLTERIYTLITHKTITDIVMAGGEVPKIVMYSYHILSIIFSLILLVIFERWFKGEFEGSMSLKGFGVGMKYALPVILFWVIWYIIQIAIGTSIFYVPDLETILMGFRAGTVEEVAFRGLGVALLLRKYKEKDTIVRPSLLAAGVFGLTHLVNIFSGDEVLAVLLQTVFAMMFGFIFGLIYTYCGNIWPPLIIHSLYDLAVFTIVGQGDGFSWTNIVDVLGTIPIMILLIVFFKKDKDSVVKLWHEKWQNDPKISDSENSGN
ncbi:MAG: CPBP family intramembrane metalloprotease [Lachnospiraceae bacterium]|nr:CPBP family intramembrane metalloprotease [Lachnospiraceae bacterium]